MLLIINFQCGSAGQLNICTMQYYLHESLVCFKAYERRYMKRFSPTFVFGSVRFGFTGSARLFVSSPITFHIALVCLFVCFYFWYDEIL
jgi:hypothetical protein